jgi:hypothetical protein
MMRSPRHTPPAPADRSPPGGRVGPARTPPALALPGLVLAALLALPGCGNLTAGGMGEVVVEVVGDQGGALQAPAAASHASAPGSAFEGGSSGDARLGAPALNQAGGAFQGQVTVEMTVALQAQDGTWYEVTAGMQQVEVAASGSTAVEVGRTELPEGRYERVRVSFHRAEVFVTSAPPGQGIPEGLVVVDFEGEPLVALERPLGGLLDQAGQRIRVNLRASAWVRHAVQGKVSASNFREAVQVTASPGGV